MTHRTLLRPIALSALLTAGALALSGCCGECGDVAEVAGGSYKLFQKMSTAPGTKEMKAAGCDTALVITPEMMKEFVDMVESLDKNKSNSDPPPTLDYTVVACTLQKKKKKVTCDKIAEVYNKAARSGPPEFGVTVNVSGQNKPQCSGIYDSSSKKVREMDAEAAQSVGGMGQQAP